MRDFSVGVWEQISRAIFGYQRHEPLQLEDAVRVAVVLEQDRPEWRYLAGSIPFCTQLFTRAAVVGEFSSVILQAPKEANLLVVVQGIQQDSGLTENILSGDRGVDFAVGTDGVDAELALVGSMDSRFNNGAELARPGPRVFTAHSVAGLGFASTMFKIAALNTSLVWSMLPPNVAFVLGPGGFVALQGLTSNAAASALFYGYVKRLHHGVRA